MSASPRTSRWLVGSLASVALVVAAPAWAAPSPPTSRPGALPPRALPPGAPASRAASQPTSQPTSRPALTVRTEPAQLVLPAARARIVIEGLPRGELRATANVGRVISVRRRAARVALVLALPAEAFPRRLCLLLWQRERDRPYVLRVPLFAYAQVPVETRPQSQVRLRVGGRTFGPVPSDAAGKATLRVLVGPGVLSAEAQVVDDKGLETRKTVGVRQPSYPLLAVLRAPVTVSSAPARTGLDVFVASADLAVAAPRFTLRDPRGATPPLAATLLEPGLWRAAWRPSATTPAGRWELVVAGAGTTRKLSWELAALPAPATRPLTPRAGDNTFWQRLRGSVGLSLGLLHDLGSLRAPHVALSLGADHPLGRGRLGLRLGASIAWSSQTSAPAPASDVQSDVLLLPLSVAATYELAWGRLAPYAALGFALSIVRGTTTGTGVGTVRQTEAAPGLLALLGARYRLGPGGVFLEGGYLHARVDTADLALRAGLIVQAGYRLELGAK